MKTNYAHKHRWGPGRLRALAAHTGWTLAELAAQVGRGRSAGQKWVMTGGAPAALERELDRVAERVGFAS